MINIEPKNEREIKCTRCSKHFSDEGKGSHKDFFRVVSVDGMGVRSIKATVYFPLCRHCSSLSIWLFFIPFVVALAIWITVAVIGYNNHCFTPGFSFSYAFKGALVGFFPAMFALMLFIGISYWIEHRLDNSKNYLPVVVLKSFGFAESTKEAELIASKGIASEAVFAAWKSIEPKFLLELRRMEEKGFKVEIK